MNIPKSISFAGFILLNHHYMGAEAMSANKDTTYYPYPNFVNPNTYYEMYYKDAENVIADMDKFSALYIKHHGCV